MLVEGVPDLAVQAKTEVVAETLLEDGALDHFALGLLIDFLEFTPLHSTKPTSKTSAFMSQMSSYSSLASIHFRISFLSDLKSLSMVVVFSLPQPKYCE